MKVLRCASVIVLLFILSACGGTQQQVDKKRIDENAQEQHDELKKESSD